MSLLLAVLFPHCLVDYWFNPEKCAPLLKKSSTQTRAMLRALQTERQNLQGLFPVLDFFRILLHYNMQIIDTSLEHLWQDGGKVLQRDVSSFREIFSWSNQ